MLTSSRKVDECKPRLEGEAAQDVVAAAVLSRARRRHARRLERHVIVIERTWGVSTDFDTGGQGKSRVRPYTRCVFLSMPDYTRDASFSPCLMRLYTRKRVSLIFYERSWSPKALTW